MRQEVFYLYKDDHFPRYDSVSETAKIYLENTVPCNILNLVDEIVPFLTYDLGLVDKTCGGWSNLKRNVQCK